MKRIFCLLSLCVVFLAYSKNASAQYYFYDDDYYDNPIMFEVGGVPLAIAKEALRLAAQKLPVKTKFVVARDFEA